MVETLLISSGYSKKKLEMELNQIVKTSRKRIEGENVSVKKGVKLLIE
jgi:hypothetical protein